VNSFNANYMEYFRQQQCCGALITGSCLTERRRILPVPWQAKVIAPSRRGLNWQIPRGAHPAICPSSSRPRSSWSSTCAPQIRSALQSTVSAVACRPRGRILALFGAVHQSGVDAVDGSSTGTRVP